MSNVLHAPCDAATAQARDEAGQTGHPRFVIATTILASSLAFVDGSVVNVGLPAIGASFRADAEHLQWVVNAYLLPLSALLLLGGAVGDRFGRQRLLIAGVACSVLLRWLAQQHPVFFGSLSPASSRASAPPC